VLILKTITDSITAVLGAAKTANDMEFYAGFRDMTVTAFAADRNVGVTAGTTPVSLVTSPGTDVQRVIDYISVFNTDTASKVLSIFFNDNSTTRILWKGTIGINERVQYQEGSGWKVFDASGQEKVTQSHNASPLATTGWNTVVLSGDVINNNGVANTIQDVTGLTFDVVAGNTYYFEALIPYTAQATTTGSIWTINGPSFSLLHYTSEYTLTATSKTVNSGTAYQIPTGSSATSILVGNIATIWGFVKPSENGNIQVKFASEIAGSAITAKAGAYLRYLQTL